MTLTPSSLPPLIADDCGLDFLNSVAAPWGEQIEWIGDGQSLLAWLEHADLIPRQAAIELQKNTSAKKLDAVAAKARDLREWFRTFVRNQAGRGMELTTLADLDRINRLMAHGAAYRQIELRMEKPKATLQDREPNISRLQWHRRWRTAEDLLVPIAEAMGDTICMENFERVKNCEGPKCTLWFNDTSKNHTRRWCMMSVCGNRAKAAAHRARIRSLRQND